MASIDLDNVSVHFLLPEVRNMNLRGALGNISLGGLVGKGFGGTGVTAVNNVTLHLRDGDRIGLIGHNGAGKSTLLRLMGGILPPTSGRIRIEGRLSALLSIHLGLNSEASGYENIRYRARHMGRTESEINEQFDDICAFSELGEYLKMPMKTYSNGMRLRLAFAIATAFKPEILVLDEWLSAGDAQFQKKAAERLRAMIHSSGIFAFASHSPSILKSLCNKGLVMRHGSPVFFGDIDEALAQTDEAKQDS